jgi:hypothetical protein
MIAARSSKDIARQSGAAAPAAFTAASASLVVEFLNEPRTCWWSCGCTTFISAPPPLRFLPLMCARRVCCLLSRRASSAFSSARSGLRGA